MNEKFFELPEEKRLRIINAGFEVFAQSEYKKASTEEIAAKAGISKGLLFYYFHNKKALFLFLYDYAYKTITENVVDAQFSEITDVFELLAYAAERKYKLLVLSPYITDFVMRAFYSQKEPVSEELNQKFNDATADMFASYFAKMDFSNFKDSINPIEVIQMLMWMADGYLHEQQRNGTPHDLDTLMDKFNIWAEFFKKAFYKEDYLV